MKLFRRVPTILENELIIGFHRGRINLKISGWLAIPGLIENPYFRQSASMSKRGKLPGKITGLTNHKEKTITTSDDSTEVHEWTHASRPYEQIAKVKEIIDRPGIMYDDYLDKPSEIYSRLMELRFNNNLDPNHEWGTRT